MYVPPIQRYRRPSRYLRTLYATPGTHNSASFLRNVFTEYLRLQHDIAQSEEDEVDNSERITLQNMKDMIALTKTIRGLRGHESAKFHVIDYNLSNDSVRKFWSIIVTYIVFQKMIRVNDQLLNLSNIKLIDSKDGEFAADTLSTEDYERMLHILISHIMKILGSDCVRCGNETGCN